MNIVHAMKLASAVLTMLTGVVQIGLGAAALKKELNTENTEETVAVKEGES